MFGQSWKANRIPMKTIWAQAQSERVSLDLFVGALHVLRCLVVHLASLCHTRLLELSRLAIHNSHVTGRASVVQSTRWHQLARCRSCLSRTEHSSILQCVQLGALRTRISACGSYSRHFVLSLVLASCISACEADPLVASISACVPPFVGSQTPSWGSYR